MLKLMSGVSCSRARRVVCNASSHRHARTRTRTRQQLPVTGRGLVARHGLKPLHKREAGTARGVSVDVATDAPMPLDALVYLCGSEVVFGT